MANFLSHRIHISHRSCSYIDSLFGFISLTKYALYSQYPESTTSNVFTVSAYIIQGASPPRQSDQCLHPSNSEIAIKWWV